MRCVEFERRLQHWFDEHPTSCGDAVLPATLAEHAAGCRDCEKLVGEYRALFSALNSMSDSSWRGTLVQSERQALVAVNLREPAAVIAGRQAGQRRPVAVVALAAALLLICNWYLVSMVSGPPRDQVAVATETNAIRPTASSPREASLLADVAGVNSPFIRHNGKLVFVSVTMTAATKWLQAGDKPWERILQTAEQLTPRRNGLIAGQGSSVLTPKAAAIDANAFEFALADWKTPELNDILQLAGWEGGPLSAELLAPQQLFEQPHWLLHVAEGISPMADTMTGTITSFLRALPPIDDQPAAENPGACRMPVDQRFDPTICWG